MVKTTQHFTCQSCGNIQTKWTGRCEACDQWNSLVEETPQRSAIHRTRRKKTQGLDFVDLNGTHTDLLRLRTHIGEFDRVTGGGLVPGSAVLVGGDPGIGKSTLLLQVCARLSKTDLKTSYITGEESPAQIHRRAKRLGLDDAPVALATETSLESILDGLMIQKPDIVIIDSIQMLWSDQYSPGPGTVTQVRACAQALTRFAKTTKTTVIFVGHVTKDGQIAGPRVVEHMVDAVLYFEGENNHQFRILRAHKNRFGASDEIGVFEMRENGLQEVSNPSALFLADPVSHASGMAVFAGLEGSRPIMSEIQALVAPAAFGTPRRAVVGWDSARLAMVLAVLEAHCKLNFSTQDVYLNVAGGLRIHEPAADLAVAAALSSSLFDLPLPEKSVIFGEISLSGDIRAVSRPEARLKEAKKLGFIQAMSAHDTQKNTQSLPILTFKTLPQFIQSLKQRGHERKTDRFACPEENAELMI